MGNNKSYSAPLPQVDGVLEINETNEHARSLGFFNNKMRNLLLAGLCALLYVSCSKADLEEVLGSNISRAGCNDVTSTLKFEPSYVVAERVNESGADVLVALHLFVDGVSADEVSYMDGDLCLTNGAGDIPMPNSRSMLPNGQTYRDTFYYNYLTVDGKILQPGTMVKLQARVQPMSYTSGLELCKNDGNVATVPGE